MPVLLAVLVLVLLMVLVLASLMVLALVLVAVVILLSSARVKLEKKFMEALSFSLPLMVQIVQTLKQLPLLLSFSVFTHLSTSFLP